MSPFIFIDVLHRPAEEIGFYYLFVMGSATAGGFTASRLARRFGAPKLAVAASWVQIAGAVLLLLFDLGGTLSVATLVGPVMLVAAAAGCGSPMAISGAVNADPAAIGAASGLFGFMQMVFGALCTLVVSVLPADSALPLAVVLLLSALAGQWAFAHAD